MSTHWQVNEDLLPLEDKASFASMQALLQSPMTQVTRDSVSGVSRLSLSNNYYVKVYTGKKSRLRHWLGISRYQRELKNLAYFKKLGLHTPDLVAFGHCTRMGVQQEGVLATREVAGATDLLQLVQDGEFYARGRECARRILADLANAARLMHGDGFYHQDLKPRNILLRFEGDEPQLFFFDCPGGRRPPSFQLRRCMVKELAHIERDLRGKVRRADLMHAFKKYRGCQRLSPEDKSMAREALSYYATRRMNAERRSRLKQQ